jgi:hypothetical protein
MKLVGLVDGSLQTIEVYKGYVTASGGGDVLPTGWSVTKSGNLYTIVHNLNLVSLTDLIGNFQVFAPSSPRVRIVPISATNNSVSLRAYDNMSSTQTNFSFTAMRY